MRIRMNTDKPCDILVENGAVDRVGALVQPLFKSGCQAMIVSDTNVFPVYGARVAGSLAKAGFKTSAYVFEAGTQQKQLSTVTEIYSALTEKGFTSADFIVTLGGGVAGDLGGFAAATYLKGIDYVQVPTSLLAQTDASVGGEVSVDLPFGRDLVGAVHDPRMVISDPETLNTLPDEYFTDGMSAVIKYGCVMDADLFDRLEKGEVIDRMEETVCRCAECKKQLLENAESRMLLDFGHTFGSAFEKLMGPSGISHGRAVGIGMLMAAEVGESFGVTAEGTADRIRGVLNNYEIPTEAPFDFSKVVEATAMDKKNAGKTMNLILLKAVGEGMVHTIDRSYLVLRYKIAAEQNRRKK